MGNVLFTAEMIFLQIAESIGTEVIGQVWRGQ